VGNCARRTRATAGRGTGHAAGQDEVWVTRYWDVLCTLRMVRHSAHEVQVQAHEWHNGSVCACAQAGL
jgi:hypothetical protein